MRIVSTFLPAVGQALLTAFDTLVDDRSVVVGLAVGRVQRPDLDGLLLSPIGLQVLERCLAHRHLQHPQGPTIVAGVAQVGGAKQRVRQVLSQAPQGALVLFVCVHHKVYDAAYTGLGVDPQSAHQQPRH